MRTHRNKYQSLFTVPQSRVLGWLNAKGFNGEFTDALRTYFQTKSGLATGNEVGDHISKTLSSLGYTGTLDDKLRAFYVAKTGIAYCRDAEAAFYNNSSLDFS